MPALAETACPAAVPWLRMRAEAERSAAREPLLRPLLEATVLRHRSLGPALAQLLAPPLAGQGLAAAALHGLFDEVLAAAPELVAHAWRDLHAALERDPATDELVDPFLNHKGFQALQAHRIAHRLWVDGRHALARRLQSRVSQVWAVDIHPAARIGAGLFIDHATGVVIGETCVIGEDVSMLQDVTLGGTGKESGDRHPKIGAGVLLCAGAKVLGNVRIGAGARVGAGSVVLRDVPEHATAVGVPARLVERARAAGHRLGDTCGAPA
ncbi:MAG: serine O-acetyltransferase [Piscinibacter sp.]|uniref:serine O-acetyltransferase n=1 Tax=Piscinibacter TaxID=1114981 RepID=UPI00197C9981|nr:MULTISPECIES: serine O-acetyltransferase [Piscinibacter]MCW5667484.1 serine O-acetyltransferase [Piscinibacter sp.]